MDDLDGAFRALADPSRRRLLDSLNDHDGQRLHELCEGLNMTRQSVSKHLAVLEDANLVVTVRRGREKLHHLNAVPLHAISDRWIRQYDRRSLEALADLKHALESAPMDAPAVVYTTYINCTPEELWQALVDPAFTARYWGVTFETDWRPGSTMVWEENGARISDPDQVVLEAEPHRRLAYTWHTRTPEWAAGVGVDEDTRAVIAAENRTKVMYEIEPHGGIVRLTVTHDDFSPDSIMRRMCSVAWPHLISDLKTLLETGATLPRPRSS